VARRVGDPFMAAAYRTEILWKWRPSLFPFCALRTRRSPPTSLPPSQGLWPWLKGEHLLEVFGVLGLLHHALQKCFFVSPRRMALSHKQKSTPIQGPGGCSCSTCRLVANSDAVAGHMDCAKGDGRLPTMPWTSLRALRSDLASVCRIKIARPKTRSLYCTLRSWGDGEGSSLFKQ
jgi:hypothetical protein